MSATPPEITAPRDPAEYRRGRGVGGWALAGFGALCVLLGAGIATVAPRVIGARPGARPIFEAPSPVMATSPAPPVAAAPPPAAEVPPPPSAGDFAQLDARLSALETRQGRAAQASAAALAAAALVEAAQQSGPFARELATLRASSPDAPELAALARVAEVGAPTRAALAESFPDYAARAASAARAPAQGARLGDRALYVLSRIVTVRRVVEDSGDGVDAVLARAERLVEDGDLDRALAALDRLPPASREALAPWRMRAERRAEIDRAAAALRARALSDLAASGRSGG